MPLRLVTVFLFFLTVSTVAHAQSTEEYLRQNNPMGTERDAGNPVGADDSTIGSTRILGNAQISISPTVMEWEIASEWKRFTLRNHGEMATSALDFSVASGRYTVDPGGCGNILDAGESCEFQVRPNGLAGNDVVTVSADFGGSASADLKLAGEGDSCLQILQSGINRGNGLYRLNSLTGGPVYEAWCDMETLGGGWTLVMRFDGETKDLHFHAPYWTTTQLLNGTNPSPADGPGDGNAKFEAYNQVPGSTLRLRFHGREGTTIDGYDLQVHNLGNRPALQIFSGNTITVAGSTAYGCHGNAMTSLPEWDSTIMRYGRGPQFYGINHQRSRRSPCCGSTNMKLRMGFASNDEPWTSGAPMVGVGSYYWWSVGGNVGRSSIRWGTFTPTSSDCDPYGCGCYGNGGSQGSGHVGGNLWIR